MWMDCVQPGGWGVCGWIVFSQVAGVCVDGLCSAGWLGCVAMGMERPL